MRPGPLLVGLALFSVALAGCTDDTGGGPADPAPSETPPDAPADDLLPGVSDLVGQAPGVASTNGDGKGGADGVVYDVATGATIADATVFLTCASDALLGEATGIAIVPDADGAFTIPAQPPFSTCPEWSYTIEAAGYTMVVPLGHGPVVDGVWYAVYAGLAADPE